MQTDAPQNTVPTKQIDTMSISHEVLDYIPEETASTYKIVPIGMTDGVLEIGMLHPDDIRAMNVLNFITRSAGIPFKVFAISQEDFEAVMDLYKGLTREVGDALEELNTQLSDEEKEMQKAITEQESGEKTQLREDAPVIKIVATILRYAVDGRASDVHIENTEQGVKVRFRVDGELHTSIMLPKRTHSNIVARIKVLSKLRLDQRRKPQDGRFTTFISGRKIDFRVSTLPTNYGEKVVMRILDRDKGFIPVEKIGFSKRYIDMIERAIKKPYGMILISGPTGSGKSTTLYSMLDKVDKATRNVISLEDPVEYYMDGVNQSQVHPEIGYTFASGLRSILRQDPDVIMVGEIRDKETAHLAIQAALTGHLVLSTIHTNSATGIVSRLVDMGVDPYLIAPTLILGIAQRLVRRICPNTGVETRLTPALRQSIEQELSDLPEEYRPQIPDTVLEVQMGNPLCPAGTKGRIAVFEMFETSPELEHAILTNPTEENIRAVVRKQGMVRMKEDAMIKAFDRQIPFSEVSALGGMLMTEPDAAQEDEQPDMQDVSLQDGASGTPVDNPLPTSPQSDIINVDKVLSDG